MKLGFKLSALLICVLLVTAGCSASGEGSSATGVDPAPETSATPTTAATDESTTTTDATVEDDSPPSEEPPADEPEGLPGDLAGEIDALIDVTERLRGLEFLHSVDVSIQQSDEFDAGLNELIDEDLDRQLLEVEERVLATMGLIKPDDDLETLYRDLLTDQVLGYYEPETRQLVVRDNGGGLSATERSIVVHELVHALTDQYYGWGERLIELAEDGPGDELEALRMIGEGDATLIQTEYAVTELSASELAEFVTEALESEQNTEGLNPYLLASLALPYNEGFMYVSSAAAGSIERLYEQPPVSTEQIMEATDDPPVAVTLPLLNLEGYELVEEFTQGQGALETSLSVLGSPAAAGLAGRGWGGDRVAWYSDGNEAVAVYRFVGDEELDSEEVAEAHQAWIDARDTAAGGYVEVMRNGNQVDLVVASDPALGPLVWDALGA